MSEFGSKSTALEVVKGHDLTSYNVLVTGANQGIGLETVRALATAGATVYMTARNTEKAKEAVEELVKSTGNSKIHLEQLELDSLENVRAFVKRFLEKNVPLHILINNAGVMACPLLYTKDGYEYQFAVNHLGHFALTTGILPSLKAGAKDRNVRVVNLSSCGHSFSDILEDWNFKTIKYEPFLSYGQSKTANALFAVGLNDRYSKDGIYSNSVMPGVIMTNLAKHMVENDPEEAKKMLDATGPLMKTVPQGAATSVWAAVSKDLEGRGGLYCEHCSVSTNEKSDSNSVMSMMEGYLPHIYNKETPNKLWELSEKLTKQ